MRYTSTLGNPGSGPFELFWDIVDDDIVDDMNVNGAAVTFKLEIEITTKEY